MSNVKKGDLAIKIVEPNLGALVHVIDIGPKPKSWTVIPLQDVVTVSGHPIPAGVPWWTDDSDLRPLRGEPEKAIDTKPCEVEAT